MYLIFDTETTGLTRLSFVTQNNYKQWPRLVQLAWTLADDDGIGEIKSAIIRPDGFDIPPISTRIHRISTAEALNRGEPIAEVLGRFHKALVQASVAIAHNFNYDLGVLSAEALRLPIEPQARWPNIRICTVEKGRQFLAMKQGRKNPGRLGLSELYQTLFGFDYNPKHDASSDVRACAHIFFRLKSEGIIHLPYTH
jgi:DNA polymerase-3 subunit alpha